MSALYVTYTLCVGTLFTGVTVGLQQTFYSVRESQGVLRSVCANLTGDADRRVVVNINTIGSSARGRSCIFRLLEIGFDLNFCICIFYSW